MAERPPFDPRQVMFTLAMVSYRGLEEPGAGTLHDVWLRNGMQAGLDALPPLAGDWDIVWGPATSHLPFTLFDDSAAYVARHRRHRSRYAVALRGTNAFSLFDWVFGDLLIGATLPWVHGAPGDGAGAAISLSTAFGLERLLGLRGTRPLPGVIGSLGRALSLEVVHPLERRVREQVAPLTSALEGLRVLLGGPLLRDLRSLAQDRERGSGPGLEQCILAILAARRSLPWKQVSREIAELLASASAEPAAALLAQLGRFAWLTGELRLGESLLAFLSGAARRAQRAAERLEVFVTGHSKGGALAPALALFLAETQGRQDLPRARRWNPHGGAAIHSYAFAGPTPGNRAFAARVGRVLGERAVRVSNTNDIVTHAWAVAPASAGAALDLSQVPMLYDPVVRCTPEERKLLSDLCETLKDEVGLLDYAHPGAQVHEFAGVLDREATSFLAQVFHQHLSGYIEGLGLEPYLTAMDLFGGPSGRAD